MPEKKEDDAMESEDDYELLPHQQIVDLKKELEKLKKGPSPESQGQIEKLSDSINTLLSLFKEASSQMHLEEQEANMVAEKIIPIEEKLDQILEQNQKIAEGIVALADLVREMQDDQKKKDRPGYNIRMSQPLPSPTMPPMQPNFGPGPFGQQGPGNIPPLPPFPPRRR